MIKQLMRSEIKNISKQLQTSNFVNNLYSYICKLKTYNSEIGNLGLTYLAIVSVCFVCGHLKETICFIENYFILKKE